MRRTRPLQPPTAIWLVLTLLALGLHGGALWRWPAQMPARPLPALHGRLLPAPVVEPKQRPIDAPPRLPKPIRRVSPPMETPAAAAPAAPAAPAMPALTPLDGPELPVYRTALPPALHWRFELQRGARSGHADLHWLPDGEHYALQLRGDDGLDRSSRGEIGADGIAPLRYVDQPRGRGAQAANFRRDIGRVSYSGPSVTLPLPPGAQDRLSWPLQLAGVLAAEPVRWAQPGRQIVMWVGGARADAEVWTFVVQTTETVDGLDGQPVAALKLLREPLWRYDTRAEAWLDPAHDWAPVRLRWTHGDQVLELLRPASLPP
jgi:hypothetical protein